jgi:hypothetical protein
LEGAKMKSKVFLGLIVLALIGLLFGCSNGTTDGTTDPQYYDGFSVWLVTGAAMTDWKNAGYAEQPTPTAIKYVPTEFSALPSSFSVQLNGTHDYSESANLGWWNESTTLWYADPGNYYVLLVTRYWPSGVIGQGNLEWHFDEGKISGSGTTAGTINITSNNPTLYLSSFINMSDVQ